MHACLRSDGKLFTDYATHVRGEYDSYVVQRDGYYAAESRWAGLEFRGNRLFGVIGRF